MAATFNLSSTNVKGRLQKLKEFVRPTCGSAAEEPSPSSGSESWKCVFSPDESILGWSSGNRVVTLVKCSQLDRRSDDNSSPGEEVGIDCDRLVRYSSPAAEAGIGCDHSVRYSSPTAEVGIDCGYLVRSLTFAAIDDSDKHSTFWLRIAKCKTLFLITGHCNGRIRVWDVETGNLLLQLLDHKNAVSDLAILPNGNGLLASASFDGTIKIWDLIDDGNLTRTLKMGDGKVVYACRWSPDGKSLATVGAEKSVFIWNTETFTVRFNCTGQHQNNVVACDFSDDSCLLATASWDTRVIVWNAKNGHMLKEFFHLMPPPRLIFANGENGVWIRSVSFASDGAHLATVADDGVVRIWDLDGGDEPEAIALVEQGLCCSFSNSSRMLAVGTRNGTVAIFKPQLCVKTLLFLSRSAFRKTHDNEQLDKLSRRSVPENMLKYLHYSELLNR